ncbi:MAG: DegT/DnrJ/EryC1/StrS family aminotransferase [Gammaproteobacteria bacterium]
MLKPIAMSAADIDETDIAAVVEVLRSGRLALGPKAEEFENLMAGYIGVRHAVAVNSGTAALHLILCALGIGPGDEVLVPSFTFVASVNAILYVGATPVFVDIEPETYTLNPGDLEYKITPKTKAVMAVDVFGHPIEWEDVLTIAGRHGLVVIDDSAEALGAEYRGEKIGRFGTAAVFAFYPNKQITTGEGGIVVTNDDDLARVVRSLRNQGRDTERAWLQHERLGYNYRLNEMSATLGVSQLSRIDCILSRRNHVAQLYTQRLRLLELVRAPLTKPHVTMSWFVYVVTLAAGLDRNALIHALERQGIPARGYFNPIHLQPFIREHFGTKPGMLPVTESVAKRTLALPFHNRITEAQVEQVVAGLEDAVRRSNAA